MKPSPVSYEPGVRSDGVIPLCVPEIRGNEWNYVRECLDSGWVSSVGSYVTSFENSVARAAGMDHAVAIVNGTAALHLALQCCGVRPDDEVLVSTLTFIAPANAIRYTGAHPVFVDAEPTYWQMDPDAVERFLTDECDWDGSTLRDRATGRRVSAIVPVDVLGAPVDAARIVRAAKRFGLAVIEDATESLGTLYNGRQAGSLADATCFSFNGNKLITTGGGGMIATNDAALAKHARHLSTQAKDDPIEYVHGEVGYNYRLTNVQAAIGVAQMENLKPYIAAKRRNAERYAAALSGLPGVSTMREAPYAFDTYWLYTILVDATQFGMSSRELLRLLGQRNIQARPLWQPLHKSPAHAGERVLGGEVAERLHRDALSLPSSVGLSEAELETVASTITQASRK